MKVLHVVPTFFPATYWGGPIHSLHGLCNALAGLPGVALRVLTTDAASPRLSDAVPVSGFPVTFPGGYEVYFCRRRSGADFSPGMLRLLWPMIRWADVVHLTSVYSAPTLPTLALCRLAGKPVVWSPRGALQRWDGTTKAWTKSVWERICNALLAPGRSVLHVTSHEEERDSRRRIPKAEIAIVPNGVDIPGSLPARDWRPRGMLRLLFIGRFHPIKGIENLMRAIRSIDGMPLSLSIAGSGDSDYEKALRQLSSELGLGDRVRFLGHVDGDDRTAAFMHADLCVVPSFTENFGMVVAEALAHGVPVIASRGTPWSGIEEKGCGRWVDNPPESLAGAIRDIAGMDLQEMGRRGRAWMIESFGWPAVASRMLAIYARQAGDRP